MRTKLFTLASLLVLASMLLTACGPQATTATQPVIEKTVIVQGTPQTVVVTATPAPVQQKTFASKDPTTLVVEEFGEPETLDVARDYESGGGEILQNTYDFLVFYNGGDTSKLVPMLATEVPSKDNGGISADGLTYTFKIRQGVKFHNGDDLKASDVAFSMQRGVLQGGTSSPQWLYFEPLFGSGVGAGNNDITDLIDTDGKLGLADNREALQKVDAAKLKDVCTQVQNKIVADDAAGTVTVTLAQAWGPFLVTLAGAWGGIQDKAWVGQNGGWDGSCDTWQNFYGLQPEDLNKTKIGTAENGTGPFMVDHWTPKQEIVLKANPNYWVKDALWQGAPTGAPKLQTVIVKIVAEFSTRYAALKAGDADIIQPGSQSDWPQMDTLVGETCDPTGKCEATDTPDAPLRRFTGQTPGDHTDAFFNFAINTTGGNNFIGSGKLDGNGIPADFFSDIHVRKAFAYCFDWDTYIQDVMVGEGKQLTTMFLPGMPGWDDNGPHYSYDAAKCEEEFKASTWKSADGKSLWDTGFRMTIGFNTGNTARQSVGQIWQANLAAINEKFVVEVTGLPWAAYLEAYRNKKLPFFIIGWIEDIPDPHNWAYTYAGIGGPYSNKQGMPKDLLNQFAPVISDGAHETDPAKRSQIYSQLNQLFYDNVPTVLLAYPLHRLYQQRWVSGYMYNPLFSYQYYYTMSKS